MICKCVESIHMLDYAESKDGDECPIERRVKAISDDERAALSHAQTCMFVESTRVIRDSMRKAGGLLESAERIIRLMHDILIDSTPTMRIGTTTPLAISAPPAHSGLTRHARLLHRIIQRIIDECFHTHSAH
jgi:hypothetical protein